MKSVLQNYKHISKPKMIEIIIHIIVKVNYY